MTDKPLVLDPPACETYSRLYVKWMIAKRDHPNQEAHALAELVYHEERCEICAINKKQIEEFKNENK